MIRCIVLGIFSFMISFMIKPCIVDTIIVIFIDERRQVYKGM